MPSFDDPYDLMAKIDRLIAPPPEWRLCHAQFIAPTGKEQITKEEKRKLCTLLGLPTELVDLVCTFLHKKSDLKQLVSTSTRLYAIAMPHLYRKVHFFVEATGNPVLTKMLTPENPGMKHIREITVSADFWGNNCGSAYIWMHCLLNALPRDTLRRFW